MKKIRNYTIIIMFLVVLLGPLILMNTTEDAISEKDNRVLAANPIKASKSGIRLADAVDEYVNDRIGFRESFISLNSMISYYIFSESPSDRVILGQNGWLFYNTNVNGDGATIPQFLGKCSYTDEQLKIIADNLLTTEKYLNDRGCEFVLFIAPNKERVYANEMPSSFKKMRVSDECCTEQIVQYLEENTDIRVVWPYDDLEIFSNEYPNMPMYYQLDTHWNQLGGYIGARALLKELGIDIPKPQAENFLHKELDEGDLKTMMSLEMLKMKSDDYIPNYAMDEKMKFTDGGFSYQWIYENSGKDNRKVLMCRDSFATAMAPILGANFNYINMCHQNTFTKDLVDEVNPNVFVLEYVERKDDWLMEFVLSE